MDFWWRFRRRFLTRCAWCGGRDSAIDPINHGSLDRSGSPWWTGEREMYHKDCMFTLYAHESCSCIMPTTEIHSMICVTCGRNVRTADAQMMRRIRAAQAVDYGVKPNLPARSHR